MAEERAGFDWTGVIGRSLAFMALHQAGFGDGDLAVRGKFLERLGLPRREAANMLGTTPASLTELLRKARTKKRRKHAAKKAK